MTVYGLKSNLSRNKLNGRLTRNGGKGRRCFELVLNDNISINLSHEDLIYFI